MRSMHRGLTGCCLAALCLLPAGAHARVAPGAPREPASQRPAVPAFRWADASVDAPAGSTPEQAARFHLDRLRHDFRAPRGALDHARLLFVHDTGRGGIIVALRQTAGGVDLAHADIKVLLDRSLRLVAVAGAPHPGTRGRAAFTSPAAELHAAAAALRLLHGLELSPYLTRSREASRAGFDYFDLAAPAPIDLRLARPVRVKPVWYPQGEALVPAHLVEVQAVVRAGDERRAHAVILGLDGRELHRKDLVAHESYTYRTFADADGRPVDSPLEDYNPHPAGEPTGGPVAPVFPPLIEMEGFNTNPDGAADPWLPPGATQTVGNNVDAYADHVDPDGLSGTDYRAKINGFNSFDYVYDISLEPLADQTQVMAAVTSLFYTNNWLHDWFYDSGFNEAAGNAQADNYGRGGEAGDPLRAEAQDAAELGVRNNANMSTPLDGESPTMQMYLWSPLHEELHLTVDGDDGYTPGQAAFGPRMYDVTGDLVIVDDGTAAPTRGCEPPLNAVSGKIVLVDRGDCTYEQKATHLQLAGAAGVLIVDDGTESVLLVPASDPDTVDPFIPTQGLLQPAGEALKAAVLAGPVEATMVGATTVERDGTLDNLIVAHEWGHYIHHRLTTCGGGQCGAHSEGWGDFNAILMSLREGDPLDGTYNPGTYGTFDATGYYSNRRVAYTTDMAKNALTFRHISDGEPLPPPPYVVDNGYPNAEVHNAGEVWCTMMWEVYIALHDAHAGDKSFEEVHRLMSDYMVAGLMMTATDPSFTEQRDGILAAARAADHDDYITIAEAFARRGVGTCAVSPNKTDDSFSGVVEDYEVRARGVLLAASIDDSTQSCDDDGFLDDTESGKLRVTVRNEGVNPMTGATLSLVADSPTVTFPGGAELPVPDLDPLTGTDLAIDVALAPDPPELEHTVITATLTTPDGCETDFKLKLPTRLNGDVAVGVTATDDVDAPVTPWTIGGGVDGIWAREVGAGASYLWHAVDYATVSDTWLASPTLDVADDEPLVISFVHAYKFEFTDNTYWDGGLIEISPDDGETWQDISEYVDDPGYDGAINNEVNPIHMRPVFGGESPNYPKAVKVILDLGDALAGKKVKLRFRVGTDGYVGDDGWFIDNIAFAGITNTPFSEWVPDAACNPDDPSTTSDTDTPTTSDSDDPTEPGDAEDAGTENGPGIDDGGCGCTTTRTPGLLPLLAPLALRRRRRPAR